MKGMKGLHEKFIVVSVIIAMLAIAIPVLAADTHYVKINVYDYDTDSNVYSAYMVVYDSDGNIYKGPVYGKKMWTWSMANGQYTLEVYNNSYDLHRQQFSLRSGMNDNVTIEAGLGPDDVAPTTTSSGDVDWTNQDADITLSCSDSVSDSSVPYASRGSGCDHTMYKINSGNWITYDSAFTVSAEGDNTVSYYSVDNATNQEQTRTNSVKIDKTAPTTTISLSPASPDGDNNWYVSDVTVTLTCDDSNGELQVSGCDYTKYRINSGDWQTYTDSFILSNDDSNNTIDYYSIDVAGNQEATNSEIDISMDQTAPYYSNRVEVPSSPYTYESGKSYNFLMDWYDDTSGLSEINITFDGVEYAASWNDPDEYIFTITDLPAGDYKYKWKAWDNAGNSNETQEYTYTVEKAEASLNLTASPSWTETYGTQTTVTCALLEGDSGATLNLTRDGNEVDSDSSPVSETETFAAGEYSYECEYVETQNYTDPITEIKILTINKADPTSNMHLELDGTEGNVSVTYPVSTNATGWNDFADAQDMTFVLKRDSVNVSNPDILQLAAGEYEYVYHTDGGENYTAGDVTWYLTVDKATPTVSVNFTSNPISYGTAAGATCSVSDALDYTLYRNGTGVGQSDNTVLAAGDYNYTCVADGNENYTAGSDEQILTVNKASTSTQLFIDGNQANNTVTYGTQTNATATTSALSVTLYRDGQAVSNPEVDTFAAGTYNYTAVNPGNENYTGSSATWWLTVSRINPTIHLAINGAEADGNHDYKAGGLNVTGWTETGDENATAKLYLDGTEVNSPYTDSDMAAGNYEMNYTYEQSQNYSELTVTRTLTINKIAPTLKLEINGVEGDVTIDYQDQLNVTGTMIEGDSGATTGLYRNATLVSNPDTTLLGGGAHRYNFTYTASENYTDSEVSYVLTVNKLDNPVWLLLNGVAADASLTYEDTLNATAGAEAGTVNIYRNGTDVTSENGQDVTLAAGSYTYFVNATGTENYTDNTTGVSFNVDIAKKGTTMRLWLNGTEGNKTYSLNDVANFTAALDVSKIITLTYPSGGKVGNTPQEAAVTLDEEKDYNVTAYWNGDENYTASSVSYFAKVPDTTAPLITVNSPLNQTYQIDQVWANATMNDDGSWMKVDIDGTNYTLENSSGTWNKLITGLGEGAHAATFYGADEADNENISETVYFSIPCLSHLVNTTVDGVYYVDNKLNIAGGNSTITCSNVSHSTVRNSTIIDSTVIFKDLTGMYIEDSFVDPNYTIPSVGSVIKGNSNVTMSSIRYSTVSDQSNVTYSEVVNSTVNNSNVYWSDIWYSDILRSDIEYSWIENSNITDSIIKNSTVNNSDVTDAYIENDFMYNGTLVYNGTNYTTPTNLTDIYNPDSRAPVIGTIVFSNSTPAPGDTVNVTVTATDNVAVANVTFNSTLYTHAANTNTWTGTYAIPSANGTYEVEVVATDHTGNQGKRNISIIVNTTADPQVEIDANPPVVGANTLSAAVSDDTSVVSCQLYINDGLVGNMTGTPTSSGTVTYAYTFGSTGTYTAFASCTDSANRTTNGTAVNITVTTAPTGPGGPGGPGGRGGTVIIRAGKVSLTVPDSIQIQPGETGTFDVTVANTGEITLTDVSLDVGGLPISWFTISSSIDTLSVNNSVSYSVTINVPATEPIGTKELVIKVRTAERYGADATTTLIVGNVTAQCDCPDPSGWSDCVDGEQTRTNYICDTTTGWVCDEFTETRACTVQPPGPGGITGAILGVTENPTALGGIIVAAIVIGSVAWSMRKGKKKRGRAIVKAKSGI
ncbi:MAG: beta strand repeat-containing protein [Candidatus Aenigmatarchaeota archaeon]